MNDKPLDKVALRSLWVSVVGTILATVIGLVGLHYARISAENPGTTITQKLSAQFDTYNGRIVEAAQTVAPPMVGPGPTPPGPSLAPGQPSAKLVAPAIIQSATTNGVTASITGLYVKNDNLYANIRLTNATGSRFYFQDAQVDPAQTFALASGGVLSGSYATQMPICTSDFAGCIGSASQMAPSHFSYVDPKSTLDIGLYWTIGTYKETAQAGSFSLVLIGRLMASDADTATGPQPQMYRFNFTDIPISH